MPADAGARLQDVHARVPVGEADHFPHIEAHAVRHDRKLVGEGNVHIAVGVFDQLGHLGRARIGGDAGPAHETLVECQRLASATRCDAADRAVVVGQLFQNASGQHPLRAVGDRDVRRLAGQAGELEIRTQPRHQVAHHLGRADGACRFEDHHVASLEHARDFAGSSLHVGNIRRVVTVLGERRRHRDHEDVGRFDLGRGAQQAALDDALHKAIEIDFLDMDLAAVDRIDYALRHIEAEHRAARAGNDRGGRKSDIAQADNADLRLHITVADFSGHSPRAPRYAARRARPRRDCARAPWPNRQPYRRAG